MKKSAYIILFLVAAGALVYYGYTARSKGVIYATDTIAPVTIRATCTATGTINPLKNVLVGTQVSGRIKALYADYNSLVRKSQLIAEIDPAAFEAQLEQARANLFSAKASLAQSEATLLDSGRIRERCRQLFANNVIGKSEMDTAETNYDVAESRVRAARAQVIQSEAAFKYAETNLRYTKIFSPVEGIVISRNVDIGQTVAATFQTPTLFTIAEDLKKMQINTNVDEADIGQIEAGQEAEFSVDAYPERTFSGTVVQVRNAPIVVQNVVTYDVVISVDNSDLRLKPGMTANVSIIISTKNGVLGIPNSALRFWPDDFNGDETIRNKKCVWIVKDGKAEYVDVQTGIDDYTYTELVSGQLSAGQEVIIGYADKKRR